MDLRLLNGLIGGILGLICYGIAYLIFRKNVKIVAILGLILFSVAFPIVKTYITPRYELWQFEQKILQSQIFNSIAKNHPSEYKIFISKVRENIFENEDPKLVQIYSRDLIHGVIPLYLSRASDEAITNYLHERIKCFEKFSNDPDLIIYMEYPTDKPIDINNLSPQINQCAQGILDAQAQIIKSTESGVLPVINDEKAKLILETIGAYLGTKYNGEDLILTFTDPHNTNIDKKIAAQIIMDYYKTLYDLGPSNVGITMRSIASESLVQDSNHQALE